MAFAEDDTVEFNSYIDLDYLKERVDDNTLKRVTKEKDGDDEIDELLVSKRIIDAQSIVDSKIGSRYSVPLDSENIPERVKQLMFSITLYFLYRTHRTHKIDEEIKWGYENAIKELNRIEDGKSKLIGVSELNSSPTKVLAKTYGTPTLRFGKEFLEGR